MTASLHFYAAGLALLALTGCGGNPDSGDTATPAAKTGAVSSASDKSEPGHEDSPPRAVDSLQLLAAKCKGANVVLVSFDALQAAHVGALGYSRNTTPAIDSVARQGFTFTHAYSVASWTVPASMTWFTGVYPSEHGMTNKFAAYNAREQKPARLKDLSPGLITLAEVLKQNGYATGGFTGNAGVSGGFGYDQGFDVYFYEPERFGGFDRSIPEALHWIAAHRHEKLFVFLHGYDVHGQNTPEEGFDYRFVDDGYDRRYTGAEQEQETLREEGLERGQLDLREADVLFWRAVYDEKIRRADDKFRRFLHEYDRLGLTEKTLFVLTSDHGTEFYEHRRFDHGFTLYNEQLHVPLVIRLPGQTAGKVIADRVSSIDVMPTIIDLLDVGVPENARRQLRGASLAAAIRGEAAPRDVFSETDYRQYTYKRSIITPDGWKLILTLESGCRELYDLNADRHETKDLSGAQRQRADELERRLLAHFKSIGHDLRARRWEVGLNPVYPSQAKQPKD
jgi:arylsulfatase A-like enzyme